MDTHTIPELDSKGLRNFGLTTGLIVAVLFGLLLPWLWDFSRPAWPWIFFAAFALWGLIAPMTMRPVYRVWMRVGFMISRITTPIILGLVFYVVFMPVGLLMRLFRWDPMKRRAESGSNSYRIVRHGKANSSLENPY